MKTTTTRLLSVLLCLAMIFCSIPQSVLAEASETLNELLTNESETVPVSDGDVYVLGEVIDSRTESSKTFRMSDGSFVAADYGKPIHYSDENGDWQDYDNTLSYSDAVDSEDIAGYGTSESDISIKLSNNSNSGNLLKIKMNGYKISLSLPDANKSKALELYPQTTVADDDSLDSASTLAKFSSGAIYKDILDGTDLEYVISGSNVKENIIVKEKQDSYVYTFELKLNGLVPVLNDDGSIALNDENTGETQLVIPKGIMSDANYAVSDGVTYSIAHKNGKKYTLTVTADAEWINSDDRVFPVKIDPSFSKGAYMTNEVDDGYVQIGDPTLNTGTYQFLLSGYGISAGSQRIRAFFKLNSLPEIPESAVIVDASLNLRQMATGNGWIEYSGTASSINLAAREITSSWTEASLTWNTQPTVDSTILDYNTHSTSTAYEMFSWDITKAVQNWYNDGNNYGISIYPVTEYTGSGTYAYVGFYSAENPNIYDNTVPMFKIEYRDTKGLESIWTYSSHGAGSAGAGYVNGFNGNLVFVHDDISTKGSILPITVSHVYNSYMAGSNFESSIPAGYGWKLSVQETLTKETIDNDTWYKYNDADGTDLYFYHDDDTMDDNVYMSEDGYGLTVTETSSGATLADDYGNIKIFNSNGQITKIQDVYGNKKEFEYTGRKLMAISYTPANETSATVQIRFMYSSGVLYRIVDGYDSTDYVDFYYSTTYDGSISTTNTGYLRKIQYSSGEYCTYEYYSDGKLKSTYDSDTGYTVTYTYNGFRVASVAESVGTTQGQRIGFEYADKYFSVRSSGNDDVYGNTNDLYTVTLFDNFGRAICSYTKDYYGNVYGASYAKYTQNDIGKKTNNKLTVSSVKGITAENFVLDGDCESVDEWTTGYSGSGYTATISSTEKLFGNYSLKLSQTNDSGYVQKYQTVTVPASGTYTLSAYVKTSGVTATSGGAIIQLGATVGEYITGTTDTSINNGWKRISVTQYLGAGTCNIYLRLAYATGTVYFDNVQLEKAEVESDYNFIENSSIRSSDYWTGSFSALETEAYRGHVGTVSGSAASAKSVYQTVPLNVPASTTFMVSGWARANSVRLTDTRRFGLSVTLTYSDNTTEEHYANFNPENTGWQYLAAAVVPEKDLTVTSAKVAFVYDYNCNTAYFDDISFTIEPAQTYAYDENTGKLKTAKDIYGQNESLTYYPNGIDVQTYSPINNGTYTYDYHYVGSVNTHDVKKIDRSLNGVTQTLTYEYDEYGNVEQSVLSNSVTSEIISSSATYTDNGNFLASSTDSLGSTTEYGYDSVTKLLKYIQDANGNKTAYIYDNRDRVTTVYLDADKDDTADTTESSVAYLYASGRLSGINTATTAYTISYDTFGNMVSVYAGYHLLAAYTYTAGNGKLTRMTYGNGEYEDYTYDNLDRLVKVTYNGNSENDYIIVYDSNGRLAKAADGKVGITYLYEYDSLDRLIRAYQKDSSGNTVFAVENSYDEYGRAKSSNVVIGNKSMEYVLTYKTNTNLVSHVYMPETSVMSAINYTYDNFDRLTIKNSSLSTLADIYEKYEYYTYTDADGTVYTTPLISKLTFENKRGSTDVEPAEVYEYTYNALGYITSVSRNGIVIAYYSYDALGQLVREINADSGEIYVYTYDKAGNITKKEVYTGDIGNLTDTINYTYSTSSWKDLLTNYDGTAISYDHIGNPTNWVGISSLTWNGRQLDSVNIDGYNTVDYTYDSEGIRTQKRVFDSAVNAYVVHNYVLDSTRIVAETVTDEYDNSSYSLYYLYDSNGYITGLHYNNAPYYFQKNIQGDIIRICNASGNIVVEYAYDAWGNILSVTGSMASTLGQYNPFRYRGYYYDSETGLYYLQSRYYDPEVGRFVNADKYVSTGHGILKNNMFAYCLNNSVMGYDPTGECWRGDGYYQFQFAGHDLEVGDMCKECGKIVDTYFFMRPYLWSNIADLYPELSGKEISEKVKCAIETEQQQSQIASKPTSAKTNCFVAGTLIKAENGDVAIEDIEVGDYVWAHNPETGETALKRVVQTFVNETDTLIEVVIGNEIIKATPEHPFYVVGCNDSRTADIGFGAGWVKARDLRVGDALCLLSGETVTVESVTVTYLDTPVKVYNFEVEDFHTYFVGEDGWLVHNTCYDANQQAVISLAKEYRHGTSLSNAEILWSWAEEYNLTGHGPKYDSYQNGKVKHIQIVGIHVNIR